MEALLSELEEVRFEGKRCRERGPPNSDKMQARRRLLLTNCTLTKRRRARALSIACWRAPAGMSGKV